MNILDKVRSSLGSRRWAEKIDLDKCVSLNTETVENHVYREYTTHTVILEVGATVRAPIEQKEEVTKEITHLIRQELYGEISKRLAMLEYEVRGEMLSDKFKEDFTEIQKLMDVSQ